MKSFKELSVKARKLALERKRSDSKLFPLGLQAECMYELMAEEIMKLEKRLEKLEGKNSNLKVVPGTNVVVDRSVRGPLPCGEGEDYSPEPSYDHSWDPHYRE